MAESKFRFVHSIRFKLTIYFLFLILLPIVFFVTLLVREMVGNATENYGVSVQRYLAQSVATTQSTIDLLVKSGKLLATDESLIKAIRSATPETAFTEKKELQKRLFTLRNQYNYMKSVKLLHTNPYIVDTANLICYDKNLAKNTDVETIMGALSPEEPYRQIYYGVYLGLNKQESLYLPRAVDVNPKAFTSSSQVNTLCFPIMEEGSKRVVAVLEINMLDEGIYGGFSEYLRENQQKFAILKGETLLQSNDMDFFQALSKIPEENGRIRLPEGDYYVYTALLAPMGLSAVVLAPEGLVNASVDMGLVTLVILLGCLTVAFCLLLGLFNKPLKNLLQLEHQMRTITKDNIDHFTLLPVSGKDEVAALGDGYNIMIQRIKTLLLGLEQAYQSENRAIYQNLDEKLKAHFLFNALDAIRLEASANNQQKIEQAVGAVMNYLSYTLKNKDEDVLLREELKYVSSFINIHNIIRDCPISYQVTMTPEVAGSTGKIRIIKFLLQPLVENAVKHGFRDRNENCEIILQLSVDKEQLLITLEDNGRGFSTDEPPVSGFGIGLSYINEKLARIYGENYAFSVSSFEEIGTCVTICLPLSQ